RSRAAAAARSAYRAETQPLDDPGDVLAVEAAADHHCDFLPAPDPRRGKNRAMPEGINHGLFEDGVSRGWRFFPGNRIAQGRADEGDGEISCPADQPEL